MNKILGKNVTISIAVQASPQELEVVGCARNCSITTSTAIAPISTIGSGTNQEFKGLSNSWAGSIDGFATVDENATIAEVRQLQWALEPIVMSFQEVTDSGTLLYVGSIIITSVQTTGNYADAETYAIQFQGTGALVYGSGGIFGNPPTSLFVASSQVNPSDGTTTLGIRWTGAVPSPNSYTMEIVDISTATTTIVTDITTNGDTVDVITGDSYSFRVKSIYDGIGESIYSDYLYYP